MSILLIFSVGASVFYRAGMKFSENGVAITRDALTDEQLSAIEAEKRLSVKQIGVDAIPEGVLIHESVVNLTQENNLESDSLTQDDEQNTSEKATEKAAPQGAGKRTSSAGK